MKIYDISQGNRLAFSRFTTTNYMAFVTYNPQTFTVQFGAFSLASETIATLPAVDRQFTAKPRILFSTREASLTGAGGEVHVAICSSENTVNPSVVFLEQMVVNEGVLTNSDSKYFSLAGRCLGVEYYHNPYFEPAKTQYLWPSFLLQRSDGKLINIHVDFPNEVYYVSESVNSL